MEMIVEMRKQLLFFAIFFLMGCTHGGIRIKNLDVPLVAIQNIVVDSLPLGKRAVSPNGREFFSKYFVVVEKKIRPARRLKVRYYAHVYVLGDRRPYVVEGMVHKEVRQKGGLISPKYSDAGINRRLSTVLMRRIKNNLSKRRGGRNTVDDFRIF